MKTCPQCQLPVSETAPEGLCPRCLANAAFATEPISSDQAALPDIANLAEVAKRLPQFDIIEQIGRGGMGVVYKARQVQLDRVVALKIIPPSDSAQQDFVERFSREARAMGKLNHPNVVQLYDFGETNGLYYIVMEFVDGANLRQLMQTGKLTPIEAMSIVPKICSALEYAHEEGVIHRDIKPENLLVDKRGHVKIADFGLAKLLRREPLEMTLTLSGMALGTARYMAPEQLDKPESVDHRADIYSLGVVIYEMLTGEVPQGKFLLPSEKVKVDSRMDEIVMHALERDVHRRYQNASEVRMDVENVSRLEAPPPHSSSGPLLLVGCMLASLATIWFLLEFWPATFTMISGPDLQLIEIGRQWHLGTNVMSIFGKIITLTVLLTACNFFLWKSYWRRRNA